MAARCAASQTGSFMHSRAVPIRITAAWTLLIAILLAGGSGCSTTKWVSVRSTPHSPLVERLKLTSRGGGKPSERTVQLLRRYALEEQIDGNQQTLLVRLQSVIDQEPTPDKLHAFAELAYLEGKRRELTEPKLALDLYEAAVAHAYLYLFDKRFQSQLNPYDPLYRGACDLYNGSLESALRIVKADGSLLPGHTHTIRSASQTWEVSIVARNARWQADDFERFEFVSDYEVAGLVNQYQTYGLGVPLIAVRKPHDADEPGEKYYPPGLSFPVTAFLRVVPEALPSAASAGQPRQAIVELYDPLVATDIVVNDVRVPLESDLTTPLAYFLNNEPDAGKLATWGLLRPDRSLKLAGLYMTQPYEPDKIPVLFVHGLWSDPTTWTDMFNDLRSAPEIRQHYQFWFYLYPTGQPFWVSAARLREDLAEVRQQIDPAGRHAALEQMVVVGHSMGGLVSKMQTVASGDDYWTAVSEKPFRLIKASDQTRQTLERTFFFAPNPAIRRVITIGTPHRGSDFANKYTRFLGRKLIFLPEILVNATQELYRENPDLLVNKSPVAIKTSIDSLAPDSPLLPVLLASHHPPTVKYHNIVGVVGLREKQDQLETGSDGVVSYTSAHLDDVQSELVVDSDHVHVHRHPLTILEVRRILLEHLASQRPYQGPTTPPFRTTSYTEPPRQSLHVDPRVTLPPQFSTNGPATGPMAISP
jgi:hypothetical protein